MTTPRKDEAKTMTYSSITAVSSEAWAKLRDWASVAGRGRLLLSGSVAHASLKTAVSVFVCYLHPIYNIIIILFPSHHLIISSCTVLRIWPDLACRGFAEELGHVSVGGNIQSSCDSGGNRSRDLRL